MLLSKDIIKVKDKFSVTKNSYLRVTVLMKTWLLTYLYIYRLKLSRLIKEQCESSIHSEVSSPQTKTFAVRGTKLSSWWQQKHVQTADAIYEVRNIFTYDKCASAIATRGIILVILFRPLFSPCGNKLELLKFTEHRIKK